MRIYISLMSHGFSHEGYSNMSLKTPLLHFLDTCLLHHDFMVFHELGHLLSVSPERLSVSCSILQSHIYKVWLELSWLNCWCWSPILKCFVVGGCPNEARIVEFSIHLSILLGKFWLDLERFVLMLMSRGEVSRDYIRNFQLQSLMI